VGGLDFLRRSAQHWTELWQVDQRVFDNRQSPITLGIDGGRIQNAYDVRNLDVPFLCDGRYKRCAAAFTPGNQMIRGTSCMVLEQRTSYCFPSRLVVMGTRYWCFFSWTTNRDGIRRCRTILPIPGY
jgi:hypothetical protein